MFKAMMRVCVIEQAYRVGLDKIPCFIESEIGNWHSLIAIFDSFSAIQQSIYSWNLQKPWQYELVSTEPIDARDVPKGTYIKLGPNHGYILD